ncbi:hypothetical protein U2P60_14850 [Brucella sp. H1_1004]|uniref:hypothetical protein n=1 Tax=Brucella sp. H1_1004 TaxID=3110109 RepID=UPI0039B4FB8F
MNRPRREGKYPDRNLECEAEMAAKVVDALDEAEAAGWGRLEAAKAMLQAAHGVYIGESGTDPDE